MQYNIGKACSNCSQAHNAVIIQCSNSEMTTKSDSGRFTYETYTAKGKGER